MKRRGLLAAAAALAAGFIAKLAEQPVEAGTDGDVVLGSSNSTSGSTSLTCTATNGIGFQVFANAGTIGRALYTEGSGAGLIARTGASGAGVYGDTYVGGSSAIGVHGVSFAGSGVLGESVSGYPMLGRVTQGADQNTIAIYGLNNSTYAGPGPGAGGFGVYGLSAKGHGLVGATAAAGAAALVGATNGVAGAYAAALYGPVIVGGSFTVVGGAKSAAVPHPDGSHRRLYCMESPESWFEDFGEARLDCGRADVTIDPDFAALVDLSSYHVFLTEYGNHQALYVSRRTPTGFSVEAKDENPQAGAFSWRVVAKRKDIAGPRLERVTIPAEPTLPPIPDVARPVVAK
ncbi:MAG TPA: hypothetical protein VGF24_15970 [Vicinamibacterales bacterium]